jgi:uncharacterized membrane protein
MGIPRRLYLYTVCVISLFVLAAGSYNLAALVLGQLADALGASIIGGGPGTDREQISLAIALIVVGAPIFAIQWVLVGRGWRGADASAVDDRLSSIRALYLGLVATVGLAFGVYAGLRLIEAGLRWILAAHDPAFGDPRLSDLAAMLLVALPIWWYHQRRRNSDLRHDAMTGSAAWLTRLHRYAWLFIGLIALVAGTSQVIETVASVLISRPGFGAADGWLGAFAASLSLIVVGATVFWFYANDARQAIRDAAVIGEDDRASALRATYFGAVILVALVDGGVTVASSLSELGGWALGFSDQPGVPSFLELVVGPVLVAIPFVIAGWLHWTALRRESGGRSLEAAASAERLELHLAAGVGLIFLAGGAAQLIGRLVEIALGAATSDGFVRSEMAWFIALVVVGAVLWAPAWAAILRNRRSRPTTERMATVGRAYLYLVVASSLIAGVPSAALTLYRLIDTVLGGRGVALGSELAIPIAVVIVAMLIAIYHGRLLMADLRFGAQARPVEATPLLAADVDWASRTLTLRAAIGTDLDAIVEMLRDRLPDGVVLDDGRPITTPGVKPGGGSVVPADAGGI